MEQRAHTLFRRLEEQPRHGVVFAVVAEELHGKLGDKVTADRLTVGTEIEAKHKAHHGRNTRHYHTLEQSRDFATHICITKLCQFYIDEVEERAKEATKSTHQNEDWDFIPNVSDVLLRNLKFKNNESCDLLACDAIESVSHCLLN